MKWKLHLCFTKRGFTETELRANDAMGGFPCEILCRHKIFFNGVKTL